MGRTQPRRDTEFIAWALNLNAQCTAHQDDWNLAEASVQTLNELTTTANEAYQSSRNPETANRSAIKKKQTAFATLRSFLGSYINVLRANNAVSENHLEAMGLPSRKRHARLPLPPPDDAPHLNASVGQGHEVKVYVSVPHQGGVTGSLAKKRHHGFIIRYRKEGDAEWREEYNTRLRTILLFGDEDMGKRLTLSAAWINPRLQHGPWCNEISVLIN